SDRQLRVDAADSVARQKRLNDQTGADQRHQRQPDQDDGQLVAKAHAFSDPFPDPVSDYTNGTPVVRTPKGGHGPAILSRRPGPAPPRECPLRAAGTRAPAAARTGSACPA